MLRRMRFLSSVRTLLAFSFVVAILVAASPAAFGMPPHPSVIDQWKAGTTPMPEFVANPEIWASKGVDQPYGVPLGTKAPWGGSPKGPTGSQNVLVILVDFSTKAATVAATNFDTLVFSVVGPSVRHYFDEVSYSNITIVTLNNPSTIGTGGALAGWERAPQTYAYYVGGSGGTGSYPGNCQKLTEDIVAQVDAVVDFSVYDNDSDGWVDALYIVHAGTGAELFNTPGTDIWSHAWSTVTSPTYDGVQIGPYATVPEYWFGGIAPATDMTIGVYCHELGHSFFGLPDLYDRDYSSHGLGDWSIMAGGSWAGPSGLGGSPAHPDAWTRVQMGYLAATVVNQDTTGLSIPAVVTGGNVYYVWDQGAANNEYFLLENRQSNGYDSYLPSYGLLIYHVDTNMSGFSYQNDFECLNHNNSLCTNHYLVALEQADGNLDLENGVMYNYGDSGDPYHSGTSTTFNSGSTPNSGSYATGSSQVAITNISVSGATMTADVVIGKAGAGDKDWFVDVPTYGGGGADELAVLGVAKSGGAVLAQTKDATGGGALASTYYLSAAWTPFGLALVPNFAGGATDEIATLATANSSGAIIAQVKDATGGSALASTYYLSAAWTPQGFKSCSNFAGGAADEVAVLATANSSGAVIVQVKDASGGAALASTYYLSAAWTPLALERCPSFGGGGSDELAVLATANSSGAVIVQVKDASGGAALASTYYLSAAWTPLALVDVPTFGGGGSDELAVLGTANSSGAIIVQVKDASGGSALASTYYLSASWDPVALAVVPNFGGGAADELAVLATANSSGAVIVQVRDATGGAALSTTYYVSAAWDARAIEVVPDMNANGSPELAVLAVAKSGGAIIVQVKDASTGAILTSTYYLSTAWDTQP